MSNSIASSPHIALFPSAGMGHLTPFLRLASMLSSRGCIITLITTKPTVSMAESNHISYFLSTHLEIRNLEFQVTHLQPSNSTTNDPFFLQFDAINRSVHLLHPLLSSSSPPLFAVFCDFLVASGMSQIAADLGIPYYILSTTSTKFRFIMSCLPISTISSTEVEIPGMGLVPLSSIPPPLFNPNHLFTTTITSNAKAVNEAKGILMNTFDWFEPETLAALNIEKVLGNSPPILPVGPLEAYELEKDQTNCLPWLDNQPEESVIFISFGSRTAMSRDQIRELGNGLQRSECRFLWVLKTEKVDKEDKKDLKDLLGNSFLEKTKNNGMVVNRWVNQQDILAHPAIGGFMNHCGWNSVMEAAQQGIPILAWPQHGDQRVNAEIVEKAGLGLWERDWSWAFERLVNGEEIRGKIVELMEDEKLKSTAKKVGEEARKARADAGTSEKVIMGVIHELSKKQTKIR